MTRSDPVRCGGRAPRPIAIGPGRGRIAVALLAVLALVGAIVFGGCASDPSPRSGPYYHVVAPGENLYRIGLRYRVPAAQIARANGIDDVTQLRVGQRLLIPGLRGPSGERPDSIRRHAGSLRFAWPVEGRLTSRFGLRGNRPHEGIDLGAPHGTPIHAAEAGRVIYAGRFGAYGKTVILKHAGVYRTVYAHARTLHVAKGEFVERGQRIAEVGTTGRSTGPHLHFEIRRGETAHDPLLYLP